MKTKYNRIFEIKTMKREISGFGGGYERMCRKMLIAGLRWLEQNPKAEPRFLTYKNIYGVIHEDNKDAKVLSKIVVDASKGECSGAMHQAVIGSCLWIKANGLEKYLKEMNKRDKK